MYNILVCDDEKDIVSALTIYLTTGGYQVFPAYDGTEALAILAKEDIHLVLLDIMMPKLDGIATMTKIREVSNVPVILLTAKSEDTDKILGLNVGGGRLRHQALQPRGGAGLGEVPAAAVPPAGGRRGEAHPPPGRGHRPGRPHQVRHPGWGNPWPSPPGV